MTKNTMPYPTTKIKPWPHQKQAWFFAQEQDHFYLAYDMATGKTKTFIDIANGLKLSPILIICPAKVVATWRRQFEAHSGLYYKVIAPDKGTVAKKAAIIESELAKAEAVGYPIAIVTNYEAFWRPPLGPEHNKKGRIVKLGVLSREWDAICLDEGHRIKSPGGKASWAAAKIGKRAKHRIILSGTPMPHSPMDIYSQFRFLDDTVFGTSFVNFRARYAEMVPGLSFVKIKRFINIDELTQKFYSRAIRVEKRDVLKDLPPVMHETITCELSPKARKLYETLEEDFECFIDAKTNEAVTASNALVKLLRMAQMAGGFATIDGPDKKIQQIDQSKIDSLVEKIEDLPREEPIVVFYTFTAEATEIRKRLEHKDIGRRVGQISGAANDEQAWIDGKIDTVLVQIKAGGEGIDSLKRACYGFFFSKGLISSGTFDQAVARLDRPGQTRPVTFYHIIAEGTVDEKIERAIKTGKNIVTEALNGNWNEDPFVNNPIQRKVA